MAGVHWRAPTETKLTDKVDQFKLQPESTYVQRHDMLLIPPKQPFDVGPFFFFQILNHRSPEVSMSCPVSNASEWQVSEGRAQIQAYFFGRVRLVCGGFRACLEGRRCRRVHLPILLLRTQ